MGDTWECPVCGSWWIADLAMGDGSVWLEWSWVRGPEGTESL